MDSSVWLGGVLFDELYSFFKDLSCFFEIVGPGFVLAKYVVVLAVGVKVKSGVALLKFLAMLSKDGLHSFECLVGFRVVANFHP